jgi:hypothetical protein
LKAAEDAAEGVAETAEALVVTSDGTSTDQDVASANVTIMEGITITIPAGEKLAMVSDKNLDFTSLEAKGVKAYICTGNEKTGEKDKFWLTRVNDVPANTPIMIKGPAGDYDIPEGSASIYYPDNFLVGSASAASSLDWDGYKNYAVILDKGTIAALPTSVKSFDAGKAYFHVPATIASNVAGSDQEFTIPAGGKLAMVSDYDLDFNDVSFKAYTVTGYGKNRKIWMTRVMKACAGTPLMLFGSAGTYSIPSSLTANATYVNMLLGNTSDESVILNPTMDDKTILVVILASGTIAKLGASNAPFGKGKAWLPVPTSYYESGIASTRGLGEMTFEEPEVICLTVESDATGINTVAVEKELEADAWYNLNGQRISKPNKKGLYILNGKKVIVK